MAENNTSTSAPGMAREPQYQNPKTNEEKAASLDRQKRLTAQLQAQKAGNIKPGNAEIDTKLTTADHVGQHPSQPYKPDGDEARKVGDFSRIGAKEGDTVETTPVAPVGAGDDAEATDHVVLHPGEDEQEAVDRVQPTPAKPGEVKPIEGEPLKPSGEEKRDVANLPRSGGSPLPGEAAKTEGGVKAPDGPKQGGAEGSH